MKNLYYYLNSIIFKFKVIFGDTNLQNLLFLSYEKLGEYLEVYDDNAKEAAETAVSVVKAENPAAKAAAFSAGFALSAVIKVVAGIPEISRFTAAGKEAGAVIAAVEGLPAAYSEKTEFIVLKNKFLEFGSICFQLKTLFNSRN